MDKDDGCSDVRATIGRKITKHHTIPRSRGGKETHVVRIPDRYHVAWHTFFGNLTPKEAVHFIRIVFPRNIKKNKKWTGEELYNLQLELQRKTGKILKST